MQAIVISILLAAIPTLIPALVSGLVKYWETIQNDPKKLAEFYTLVGIFVKAGTAVADRTIGVENAEHYLEDRLKKLREEQGTKSPQGTSESV